MGAINKASVTPASRYLSSSVCNRMTSPALTFSRGFRKISHTNPQFSSLLRIDDQQLLHKKIDGFIHPQYLANFYAALKAASPCHGTEIVFLHSDGATRPLPTSITRFKNGFLLRIFANKSDMTLNMEPSITDVGAGFVHDMNNALQGISGNAGFISEEAADLGAFLDSLVKAHDPADVLRDLPKAATGVTRILEIISAVEESSGHLASILRGFRDFCSGQAPAEKDQHFEVPDAIRSAVAMGKGIVGGIVRDSRIKDLAINLYYSGPKERICAFGNSKALQRIIMNLIKNAALEFKGGTNQINIEWFPIENPSGEKFVVIKVKDSGPRIPKPLADRLFRERVESTHGGTGIGLLTCAHIIHESGGEIRYESLPEKCFVITLRVAGS